MVQSRPLRSFVQFAVTLFLIFCSLTYCLAAPPPTLRASASPNNNAPHPKPLVGAVWYVSTTGNDSNSGRNWGAPLQHVQTAIIAASVGDQVWVKAGTYFGSVTLKASTSLYGGFNGTETAPGQRNWTTNVTILDGSNAGSVVTVPDGAGVTTTIDGFTIQHGMSAQYGGGIYSLGAVTVNNCIITANQATANDGFAAGGGVYCESAVITNTTISNNSCNSGEEGPGDGGGLYCYGGTLSLTDVMIIGNVGTNVGGGIYNLGDATMTSCLVESNTGGVLNSGTMTISSCAVSGNATGVGISNSGTLTLDASTGIANNTRGGVYNVGTLIIEGPCAIVNNGTPNGSGGGISQYGGMSTVTNATISGNAASGGGGAAYVAAGTVMFEGCSFNGNMAIGSGGALNVSGSGVATISQCSFQANSASVNGGAIEIDTTDSTPSQIADNLFDFNSASGNGGAITCAGNLTISNNTFVSNSAGSPTTGGAIALTGGTIVVANNTLSGNSSGIMSAAGASGTLNNNCVYGNTYFNYSGLSPGAGDVSVDPQFIDAPDGDYHLLAVSPCINAGDNSDVMSGDTDLDGNPRIVGPAVDIGCYEFTSLSTVTGSVQLQGAVNLEQSLVFTFRPSVGSPSFPRYATLDASGNFTLANVPPLAYTVAVVGPRYLNSDVTYTVLAGTSIDLTATLLAGDVNGDNLVDITDFSLLASAFGSDATSPSWNPYADLNNDGVVDINDFSLLATNFGTAGDP